MSLLLKTFVSLFVHKLISHLEIQMDFLGDFNHWEPKTAMDEGEQTAVSSSDNNGGNGSFLARRREWKCIRDKFHRFFGFPNVNLL